MADWYYMQGTERQGPISESQLREYVAKKKILADTSVWTQELGEWCPAGELEGIDWPSAPSAPVEPPPSPSAPPPHAPVQAQNIPIGGESIHNLLPYAIVSLLCCCLPLGLVATIYAAKANSAQDAGDFLTAKRANSTALIWLILAISLGFITNTLYLLLTVTGRA